MARNTFALGAALLATRAAAHGYLSTFALDGVDYEGFEFWNPDPDPNAIGWSFSTYDEGPEMDIGSPDFVCRSDGEAPDNYGEIAAGATVHFHWTSADKEINPDGWAESHRGPLLTYIARCPDDDCVSADKTSLRWTKIQEAGVLDGPASTEGFWATDEMRSREGWSEAVIPEGIASGRYVLRHEIIALHIANEGEPEFYMQCANIEVTGGGDDDLSGSGVVASELYSTSDEQLFGFDLYNGDSDTEWPIPGPELYSGASSFSAPENRSDKSNTETEVEPEIDVAPESERYYRNIRESWLSRHASGARARRS